jgi:hypothetical protein
VVRTESVTKFTGTPAGVGKVKKEDVLQGFIGEEEMFRVKIK